MADRRFHRSRWAWTRTAELSFRVTPSGPSRENAARNAQASVCVLSNEFGGEWVQLDGRIEVVQQPEAMEALVEYLPLHQRGTPRLGRVPTSDGGSGKGAAPADDRPLEPHQPRRLSSSPGPRRSVRMSDEQSEASVREEARRWLRSHWNPTLELSVWRRELHASGWACPTWPVEWSGRGLPAWADDVVREELMAAGAVGTPLGSGMLLAAPTLLAHGSTALKHRLLPRIVTGEDTWCQLFSEPGSGSDLAGLTTTAVQDGAVFVVNGQKVWSTECPPCRPGNVAGADELGRAQAQGHLLDGPAHAPAGRRCSTIAPDEWSHIFQRSLLEWCRGPSRQRGWSTRRRLGDRAHDARS